MGSGNGPFAADPLRERVRADIEFHESNGVSIKQIVVHKAGDVVYQHVHDYEHLTLLASGAVSVIIDDQLVGRKQAPAVINIEANKKHEFIALADNTVLYCIHNSERQSYEEHPMSDAIKGAA